MVNAQGTNSQPAAGIDLAQPTVRYSEFRRVARVFFGRKLAVFGLVIVILMILTAIFAPLLAPYDPYKMDMGHTLDQPSWQHLLGTDSLGRDVVSRIIFGTRTSILVAIGAIGMATLIGESLGLIAAHFGGIAFNIIMRLIDTLMAVPMLLIALLLASVLGGGIKNVIIALGVGMIPVHCRMMCGQAMTVKQNDYILAAKAMGMGDLRLMFLQIVPNAFPSLIVVITIGLGTTILAEAGLSFLGIGVTPPDPAWGSMISDGYKYILSNPAIALAPGIAIMLVVFGFNMVGDGLRDALDPKLRGVI
jgi:peptide/nickel transport system permease protein